MNAAIPAPAPTLQATSAKERVIQEQVVLVLQGGGALGAYQAGVYQALMEGGIEPDWVIGTSIGAINGAIIAGNNRRSAWSACANSGREWPRAVRSISSGRHRSSAIRWPTC